MTNSHFVVSQRDSVWQFSFKGDMTGPFTSRDAAIAAAIAEAAAVGDDAVEVVVRDADMRTETVWRTGPLKLSDTEAERLAADIERESDA